MRETVVTRWFGAGYTGLHPLLQALHRDGGRLRGEIAICTGRGLAGMLGRRVARRLGLPAPQSRVAFEVEIGHTDSALLWQRRFGDGGRMTSVFRPTGTWPTGAWIETTGPLRLELGVDTAGGGWRWVCRRAWWRGMRVPLLPLPRIEAGKRIEDGRYRFTVAFALPLLGTVLSYGGLLEADAGAAQLQRELVAKAGFCQAAALDSAHAAPITLRGVPAMSSVNPQITDAVTQTVNPQITDAVTVNPMITDAVAQANVSALGNAPAVALGNLYQATAQALSNAAHNATTAQQQATILAQAATTQGVAMIYSIDTAANAAATADIGARTSAAVAQTNAAFARTDVAGQIQRAVRDVHADVVDVAGEVAYGLRVTLDAHAASLQKLNEVQRGALLGVIKLAGSAACVAAMLRAPDKAADYQNVLAIIEQLGA